MRRKIELYIGGERVDLSDQGLILFNWTQEDASNPTAVVAPYSQQVTLPGTPGNNALFGGLWRVDRTVMTSGTQTGPDFDPMRKTPFTIYDDTGEIIESGYVRVDSVERRGPSVSYKVTLYGGVGSFFYGLSYNADGTQMRLADLDFTPDGGEGELDFTISAASVLAAWADFDALSHSPLWSVINFAPAYEGIPQGNFDAARALATPGSVGLPASRTEGGENYEPMTGSGYALVNLPEGVDEWAVKDLRSYMQRPVVNFGAVIRAIARKAAANGYTFDYSTLASSMDVYGVNDTWPYSSLWLTLPLLSSITPKAVSGASLTKSGSGTNVNPLATWTVSGASVPTGTKVTVSVNVQLLLTMQSTAPAPSLVRADGAGRSVLFLRLVGYASGVRSAASKVLLVNNFQDGMFMTPLSILNTMAGADSGLTDEDFYNFSPTGSFVVQDATTALLDTDLSLSVTGYDIDEVQLEVIQVGNIYRTISGYYAVGHSGVLPNVFAGAAIKPTTLISAEDGTRSDTVSFDVGEGLRSGAPVTKRMLMGSTKTPAQYLLSYAKMLGLYFAFDKATKTVTLCKRGEFYNGPHEDLSRRVDLSSVIIKPVAVESRWYEFTSPVAGEFAEEYEKKYGRAYGSQRINTGYEFNDEVKDLFSASVLKGAVTALERSKYFNYIVLTGGGFWPSVFLDTGVTYTMWTAGGKSADFPVQVPASADVTITYYEPTPGYEGYDVEFNRKLQLHDASGKGIDGADILVFHEGGDVYEYFKVTDDAPAMYAITGGKGCWMLDPGPAAGILVPSFQRYNWTAGDYFVSRSLDFGIPFDLAIPKATYPEGRTLYDRAWKAYLRDRLGGDTKVMSAKVDLRGLNIGQGLLRRFYWFEGANWVLNKISNYSLTTFDLTDCEFIQVQDVDNYTNGQNF